MRRLTALEKLTARGKMSAMKKEMELSRMELSRDESEVRVRFHGLAAGGDAVGRDEAGRVIFAPRAAPGDVALVRLDAAPSQRTKTRHIDSQPINSQDANSATNICGCEAKPKHTQAGRDSNESEHKVAPDPNPQNVDAAHEAQRAKGFARARLIHLETASPQRVAPPCPFFCGDAATKTTADVANPDVDTARRNRDAAMSSAPPNQTPAFFTAEAMQPQVVQPQVIQSGAARAGVGTACGGCQWQHIEYAAQLEAKTAAVREALRRIGKLGDAAENVVLPCVASPIAFLYRNKAEFVVAPVPVSSLGVHHQTTAFNEAERSESLALQSESPRVAEQSSDVPSSRADIEVQPHMSTHGAGDAIDMGVGGVAVGFYAPESHDVVDVTHCLIQQESNNAILPAARDALALGLAEPFDKQSGRGVLKRLVARTASNGDALLLAETSAAVWPQEAAFASYLRSRLPFLVGVLRREPQHEAAQPPTERRPTRGNRARRQGAQAGAHAVRLAPGRLIGDASQGRDWIEEDVGGLRLRATGDSFFQINTSLTPTLVETALRFAQVKAGSPAIDLFCGVGLFTLALARAGALVVGIEEHPGAVRDARGNIVRNNLRASFVQGDAARELRRLAASNALEKKNAKRMSTASASSQEFAKALRGRRPDVLLLDPPRAGAAACIEPIALLRPHRIVYVSCDPATLARDVKALAAHGYRVDCAAPFDLFPQTSHVETVALLVPS